MDSTNRILVVQLGTNEDEAKVSRAHTVPQGLCENLIRKQGRYYERVEQFH